MMKNIALPLVCLLVGTAAGYSLRSMSEGGEKKAVQTESLGDKNKSPHAPQSAGTGNAAAGTANNAETTAAEISLSDRMK